MFDMGGADARAGGMSASSSSADASAMAHSTGSSGAGSGSMCFEKTPSWAWSAAASVTASWNSTSLRARKRCHPVIHAWFFSQKSVTARDAHSAEDWRSHALSIKMSSKVPSKTARARVALACVWVQLLKLRKTAKSQGCKYEMRRGGMKHNARCGKAAFMAAMVASLAWMLATSQRGIHACPSLPGFSTLSNVAVSCRSVVVVAQPFSDVVSALRPGLLRQDGDCPAR